MINLEELKEKGMIKTHITLPDSFSQYLNTRHFEAQYEDWGIINSCDFPTEPYLQIQNMLGKGLDEYKDFIKIKTDEWRKGHCLPPHSDMSVQSPFVAQLIYVSPDSNHEGCNLVFGKENSESFVIEKIKTGDLLFFYTHPNNFVAAYTQLTSPHKIYVINFFVCFSEDLYANWVFKDVTMPQWEKIDGLHH